MIRKKRSFALLPKRRIVFRPAPTYCRLAPSGWYWWRVVTLSYNVNHGWIAFSDDNDRADCARDVFWDVVGTVLLVLLIIMITFAPEIRGMLL